MRRDQEMCCLSAVAIGNSAFNYEGKIIRQGDRSLSNKNIKAKREDHEVAS